MARLSSVVPGRSIRSPLCHAAQQSGQRGSARRSGQRRSARRSGQRGSARWSGSPTSRSRSLAAADRALVSEPGAQHQSEDGALPSLVPVAGLCSDRAQTGALSEEVGGLDAWLPEKLPPQMSLHRLGASLRRRPSPCCWSCMGPSGAPRSGQRCSDPGRHVVASSAGSTT